MRACCIVLLVVGAAVCFCAAAGCIALDNPVRIGISWIEDTSSAAPSEDVQKYIDAVSRVNATPVLLPLVSSDGEARAVLQDVDAVIFTGGADILPAMYGEADRGKIEDANPARDASDKLLFAAALDENLPILAICRGMQMMNVVFGGVLYQDLPQEFGDAVMHRSADQIDFARHTITVAKGSRLSGMVSAGELNVNSWHHQGVKEVGAGLIVTAVSPDGLVEGLEAEDKDFVVGVQFHPEWDEGAVFAGMFAELKRRGEMR
ncbi:MAG: gamma-glutamyl-gamma-aminobutyrate hydrolase family protein [Methanocorpusculum sp.]|nr:gamma-glutamyl-gamma-aminobutyrate hydrolase family protein [Methanocorpusculum sp.]